MHLLDLATVLYRILRTEVPSLVTKLESHQLAVLADFLAAVGDSFPLVTVCLYSVSFTLKVSWS